MQDKSIWQTFQDGYRGLIRNSKYRWIVVLGTLAYLFSPIDISPDFLPIVGWIDDGLLATLLIAEVSQLMTEKLKAKQEKAVSEVTDSVVDVEAVSVS